MSVIGSYLTSSVVEKNR